MNCLLKIAFLYSAIIFAIWGCADRSQPVAPIMPDSCQIVSLKGNFYVACDSIKTVPAPLFSEIPGPLASGTKVILKSDSIPADRVFEISLDSGNVWKVADQISVMNSGQIWARTRFYNLLSPVSKVTYSIYYKRVLVVGNSITGHGPAPEIGWTGDWGMAASSAEKDYLHIITKRLQKLNPKVEMKGFNGVGFEQNYWKYDFKEANPYIDFQPDLIIMRIAENANLDYLYDFESKYDHLLDLLTSKTTPRVICTTSFFANHEEASKLIRNVAKRKGYMLADLLPYSKDKSYTAFNLFLDSGVASHPSDKGMQAIADCISVNF